jgi:hypothetical protein
MTKMWDPSIVVIGVAHVVEFHVQVDHDNQHLVGSIRDTLLTIRGIVTPAFLRYGYLPDPTDKDIQIHSIFNYGLDLGLNNKTVEFYPD